MSPFFFAGRLKFMSEIIFETKRLYAKKLTVNSIPDLKKMLQNPHVMYAYEGAFTDEMVEAVRDLEVVTDAKHVGNGRLNIDLKRSETSVNHVITAILSNGGNIASIKTNDPTLEDVFVAITAKQRTEIKNGRN